jgi:hypothetical protein
LTIRCASVLLFTGLRSILAILFQEYKIAKRHKIHIFAMMIDSGATRWPAPAFTRTAFPRTCSGAAQPPFHKKDTVFVKDEVRETVILRNTISIRNLLRRLT